MEHEHAPNNKSTLIAFTIVIVILIAVILWFAFKNTEEIIDDDLVACTADAMQCPDGSYVGRTGPNCEFVCPDGEEIDTSNWKTYRNDDLGISFSYPSLLYEQEDLDSGVVLSGDEECVQDKALWEWCISNSIYVEIFETEENPAQWAQNNQHSSTGLKFEPREEISIAGLSGFMMTTYGTEAFGARYVVGGEGIVIDILLYAGLEDEKKQIFDSFIILR